MESLNTKIYSRQETLLSFFLPVAFFLFQYGSYGIYGIMYTYLLFCCIYYIFKYQHIPVFKPLVFYTICLVLFTFVNCAFVGGVLTRRLIVSIFLYLFCGYSVSIIAEHVDKDALYRCWKFLGIVVGVVIVCQFFQITFQHHSVHVINVLPLTQADIDACYNWIADHDRPIAFFTEPAAVVGFLIPLLAMAQQKRDFFCFISVSIFILLTSSTSGLIVLIIMWPVYLFRKNNFRTCVLVFFLVAVIVYIFLATDLFRTSVDKVIYETSGESSNMYVRVIMGWNIFFNLDIRSMIMGIPDIDLTDFALRHAADLVNGGVIWGDDELYTNTAQKLFLFSGFIGAGVYIWMLNKLYKSLEKDAKPYFWSVIVLMFFSSNFYFSGLFVMQFIFLLLHSTLSIEKIKAN